MHSRRLSASALTLVALVAGGCGGAAKDSATSFAGPEKEVATVVEDLQTSGTKRDADQICNRYLSTALVQQIKAHGKRTCAATLKESLKDADAFELQVVKNGVTVSGRTASARVKSTSGTKDRTDTLTFVKEPQTTGGKTIQVWKLNSLGTSG